MVLLGGVEASAGTFLGCAEWCASRYLPKSGAATRDQVIRYDSCVVQTQREGRCGGGNSSNRGSGGGTSRPAQTQQPAETQRQQEPQSTSQTNPCGNRCPVSQCMENVNGGGGYICQSEMQQRGPDCSAQYADLAQQCSDAVAETSHTCDEKSDSGMNNVADTASQLSLMFGQQTASSIQAACSRMAGLSAAANAAVAAYRLNCSSSINSCRSACSALVDYVTNNPTCTVQGFSGAAGDNSMISENARAQAERCDRFESKVEEANQAIANYAGTMQNAAQCAEQTSGDPAAIPEICKTNPNLPGCANTGPVDCTKPEMASNKVCICSKNPTDPACLSQKGMNGSTYSSINSASRLNSVGGDVPGGDLPDLPAISPGKPGSGGAGEAVDGRQGGSAGLSSSGGGAGGADAGSDRGQGEGGNLDSNVNAGFYGAGGGSGGYGGAGSGGGYAGKAGAAGVAGSRKSGPDLRQFLPGGKFDPKTRGIAGVSGPDGITGPHSNIWKKIQNRYQVLSPTLMP
ncbi:hypothetical protein EZJ49_01540 [Bdellovibrio bacteriovorus]|uniref:hypothetical protein n=1 Tax=Bdellovibrio bacteriovorus TaxID=959 RepID=UPI0021CF3CFE|nr:hypothetical protein [Bdellovibrio bacteriovorus]UXR64933.1 hypothetical protein EZJ49_01540 [Bdellovibrio bacteriovorus]